MKNILVFIIFINLSAGALNVFTDFGQFIILLINLLAFISINSSLSLINFKSNKSLFIYIALICISLIRTNHPETSLLSTLLKLSNFILIILIFIKSSLHQLHNENKKLGDFIYENIYTPLCFFIIFNFSTWLIGVKPAKEVLTGEAINTESITMKYLGINIDRVLFPFAGGFNNYATLLSVVFLFSLICIFFYQKKNTFVYINSTISFFSLLLVDSRSALIYPILVLFYLFLVKKNKTVNHIRLLVIWFILGPALMMIILPALSTLSFFEEISRNSADLLTGNSRFFIWGISFLEFYNFKEIHLVGYGEYGHYESGASLNWAFIFGTFENSELKTPHNSLIVTIFDIGYFGLLILILTLNNFLKTIAIQWKKDRFNYYFVSGYILFYILIANTETMMGLYSYNNFIIFLFMLISVFISNNSANFSKIESDC